MQPDICIDAQHLAFVFADVYIFLLKEKREWGMMGRFHVKTSAALNRSASTYLSVLEEGQETTYAHGDN